MDYGTLAYARPGGAVQRYQLRPGTIKIGRAPDNDIVLDDPEVAAHHAQIVCGTDNCVVSDLETERGTFIGKDRIPAQVRRPIYDGDMLRIGPFFLRYINADSRATRPAAQVPPEVAAQLPQRRVVEQRGARGGTPGVGGEGGGSGGIRRLPGNSGPPRIPPGMRRLPHQTSSYLQYLPAPFHEDPFIGRFLMIFESLLDPIERSIDHVHLFFDPRVTPETLLPWLASWVDLVLNENWPIERRRELVSRASELYKWRGTRRGLSEYIRIYTGIEPIIVESGQPGRASAGLPAHVFKVILEVPDHAQVDRQLLAAIIESEKPAHTAYILEIRPLPM